MVKIKHQRWWHFNLEVSYNLHVHEHAQMGSIAFFNRLDIIIMLFQDLFVEISLFDDMTIAIIFVGLIIWITLSP